MSARPVGTWLLAAGAVAVVASLAAAVAVIGSPSQQRRLRMDEARVADLQRLQQAVIAFHRDEGRLPPRLEAVAHVGGAPATQARDPETGAAYGYRVLGGGRYELCAVFARATTRDATRWVEADWQHPAGRHCYARRIGPTAGDPAAMAAAAAESAAAVID